MANDDEMDPKYPSDPGSPHRETFRRLYKAHGKARQIYIAGDDGDFYSISEEELKRSHRIRKGDPNYGILKFLARSGVGQASKKDSGSTHTVKHGKASQVGEWVTCLFSIHFLNLNTLTRAGRSSEKAAGSLKTSGAGRKDPKTGSSD